MLFNVENQHAPSCGTPPTWLTSEQQSDERRHYFENVHGEQWIASASPTLLRVTGGDASWRTFTFEQPDYVQVARQAFTAALRGGMFPGLAGIGLNRSECYWLISVCMSASPDVMNLVAQNGGVIPPLSAVEQRQIMEPLITASARRT